MKKPLLTEIKDIKEELNKIKKESFIRMILEGVDDPGILKVVMLAGGPACFVKGTKIRTAEGYKPIEDVEEGDMIYTINETTGEEEIKPVVFTHKYDEHTDDLLELEFEDGTIVRCTENHEFYVDGEWVAAKNLKVGKLKRKTNLGKCNQPVYDLTLLDNSNYQITEKNIIVHNSGKSFVGGKLLGVLEGVFNVDDKSVKKMSQSFSDSGLKIVNSDKMYEKKLKDMGIDPKELARIEKEDPDLWNKILKQREEGKKLTAAQKRFFEKGRLGMMLDGTGRDASKIKKQKRRAELLGYDAFMIFVNTDLETALENNRNRTRTLPEDIVTSAWQSCQENLSTFQNLFGGNMVVVDNSLDASGNFKPIDSEIQKAINSFIRKPIENEIGKKWINTTRMLKKIKAINY